ncbi:MAG: hypothetical protein ACYC91_10230 [Solirubrobacteraceae bacterium]
MRPDRDSGSRAAQPRFPQRRLRGSDGARRALASTRQRLACESGLTLVELLVVCIMLIALTTATLALLQSATSVQTRDAAYADEITATQADLARLTHDLRQATTIVAGQPNRIEFLMPSTQVVNGTPTTITLDIRYDCTAGDSLSGYTRCAREQSVYPAVLPAFTTAAGSDDIQHVINGTVSTYCNGAGSSQSGSVFFYENANTANPDLSPPPCDENYQTLVAQRPNYVQVLIEVPASGDLTSNGLHHTTTLSSGAYLRNWNLGA